MSPQYIDATSSFGAITIGVVIAVFMTGISAMQLCNYFRAYQEDSVGLKATVVLIFTVDLAHTILLVWLMYYYTIRNSADLFTLNEILPAWPANFLMESIIVLAIQTFFSVRVYYVTGSVAVALVCWLLALLRQAAADWLAVLICRATIGTPVLLILVPSFRPPLVLLLGLGTAVDICIAASICINIFSKRSDVMRSKVVLDRIVAFAIGSGLLTSIIALLQMITYLTSFIFIFLVFHMLAAKIYVNSLLASLNERSHLRAELRNSNGPVFGSTIHSLFARPAPNGAQVAPSLSITLSRFGPSEQCASGARTAIDTASSRIESKDGDSTLV